MYIIPKRSIIYLIISILSGLALFGFRSIRVNVGNKYSYFKKFLPKPTSAWNKIYSENDKDYLSVVYLDDGSIYSGFIASYINDPNKNDCDFLLTQAVRINENWEPIFKVKGLQVYLNIKNVKRIEYIEETFEEIKSNKKQTEVAN